MGLLKKPKKKKPLRSAGTGAAISSERPQQQIKLPPCTKTCPSNTNCRHGMPPRLAERLGVPSITIAGDLNDLRCYSEEQATTNIEAFVEQLEGK